MKAIMLALLLFAAPACAADKDWTWTDTGLQAAFTALLEVDREQTVWRSHHSRTAWNPATRRIEKPHHETNPVLGSNPHPDAINAYFAGVAVAHAGVSYLLRKTGWELFGVPAVTVWQGVSIGVEVHQDVSNYHLGIRFAFN